MSTATLTDRVLQETLGKLEAALLTPPIAGEMGNWVREVKQAAATLGTDWTREQHCILNPQYEQISQTDPEMLSQVQHLTEADKSLSEELAHFHEQLHALEEATSHVDWQETKLAAQQKRVEEAGLHLVLHMKKQQATAGSLLTEAVYRDRGVKD
jgi:hypothetical protein